MFCTEDNEGRKKEKTTTLKVQIRELRSQGLGYKRIAKTLGLNASTIKVFLKRHPCDDNNYCRCCGKPIVQTDKRKRLFCSKKYKDNGHIPPWSLLNGFEIRKLYEKWLEIVENSRLNQLEEITNEEAGKVLKN